MSIPKIIHQIWIGPKKRPDIWMDSVKDFCKNHNYEYVLWDDNKVSELTLTNQTFYELEKTFNGKSDILRYEILYKFGGVYIDADSFITNPVKLDQLITEFNDDVGFGFEVNQGNDVLLCGGVCLSKTNSRFIKLCIDEIPKRDMSLMAWQSIGPRLITDLWFRYKTTISVKTYESKIFYPIRWHGINDINMHTKMDLPPESVMFQYGYSTNNLESQI